MSILVFLMIIAVSIYVSIVYWGPTNPPIIDVLGPGGIITGGGGGGGSGTTLDFSKLFNQAYASLQMAYKSRLQVSGNVMTVSMNPDDTDGANNDANRRRNEVRMKDDNFIVNPGETMQLSFQLRVDAYGGVSVQGGNFYHLMQLKTEGGSRPVFTVGIKGTNLTVYQFDSSQNDTIAPVETVLGKWVNVAVSVVYKTAKSLDLAYTVAGKSGRYTVPSMGGATVYCKFGQYREKAVPIREVTSSSYTNIRASKS